MATRPRIEGRYLLRKVPNNSGGFTGFEIIIADRNFLLLVNTPCFNYSLQVMAHFLSSGRGGLAWPNID